MKKLVKVGEIAKDFSETLQAQTNRYLLEPENLELLTLAIELRLRDAYYSGRDRLDPEMEEVFETQEAPEVAPEYTSVVPPQPKVKYLN